MKLDRSIAVLVLTLSLSAQAVLPVPPYPQPPFNAVPAPRSVVPAPVNVCAAPSVAKYEYKEACSFLGVTMDQLYEVCPRITCSVRNERINLANRRGEVRVDTATKGFVVADGNTLMPVGNQAQAEVESTYTGSIALAVSAQVTENATVNCAGVFERGQLQLSATGNGIVTAAYRITASASARLFFLSVGGARSSSVSVSVPIDVVEMTDPVQINMAGKTAKQVNEELETAVMVMIRPIVESIDEQLSEQFDIDQVQLLRSTLQTVVPIPTKPSIMSGSAFDWYCNGMW